jgi:hypothetical protein
MQKVTMEKIDALTRLVVRLWRTLLLTRVVTYLGLILA